MEELLKVAMLGTAKNGWTPTSSDHPVDRLVASVTVERLEWNLLLRAGAWAVFSTAGTIASEKPGTPEAAAEESLPPCSSRAGELLLEMRDNEDLFIDSLRRLARAGQRLPHALLPACLSFASTGVREVLREVIGQRGHWLAQFNDQWRWALAVPEVAGTPSGEISAETRSVWEEGSIEQRRAVLGQLRGTDPNMASVWLREVWAKEKADNRAELLETFLGGLSPADEEFLETALTDRSKRVQAVAVRCLARLPQSALAQRMRARAETLLSYTPSQPVGRLKASLRRISGKTDHGTFEIKLPTKLDEASQRDGIQEKAPQGIGQRAYWFLQIVSLVPPSHWETQFGVPIQELIQASLASDNGVRLLQGWSQAAVEFNSTAWAEACWDAWYEDVFPKKEASLASMRDSQLQELFPRMSPEAAEARLIHWFEKPDDRTTDLVAESVQRLPRPWSTALSRLYVGELDRHLSGRHGHKPARAYAWTMTLATAATALAEPSFDEALQLVEASDLSSITYWGKPLTDFAAWIRMRQEFAREVPLKNAATSQENRRG